MEWRTVKLNEICKTSSGGTPNRSVSEYYGGDIVWLKSGELNDNRHISSSQEHITDLALKKSNAKIFPVGTVLMAMYGATVGKLGILQIPATTNQAVCGITPNEGVLNKYIFWYLYQYRNELIKQAFGGAQPNISQTIIREIPIRIPYQDGTPDLIEQKRIANEMEVIADMQRTMNGDVGKTDLLFQTCSQDFFSGQNGVNKKKLGDLCEIVKGKSPTLKTPSGEYPMVVTSEKRRTSNTYQFDGEAVCIPLVSSTGHGHASLHRIHYEKGKFALANILAAVVPKDKSKLNTKYLYYYLSFYKDELLVPLMRGVANVTIPIQKLNDVMIAVPTMDEQKKVVDLLEEVERLEGSLIKRQNLVESYFASSLNLAFSET